MGSSVCMVKANPVVCVKYAEWICSRYVGVKMMTQNIQEILPAANVGKAVEQKEKLRSGNSRNTNTYS